MGSPCFHNGTCVNTLGSYHCDCSLGYSGSKCENDINECKSVDLCSSHGTCINTPGSYRCKCLEGYIGNSCDRDLNECDNASICVHGACVNTRGSYYCDCFHGYTGKQCDKDVNECSNHSICSHRGKCLNTVGSYQCNCSDTGFHGQNCMIDTDECVSRPCGQYGICNNTVGSYFCICEKGYYGKACRDDVNECEYNPCQNNGTCQNNPGSYICECSFGFTGRNCTLDIDECNTNPCKNNGTCQNTKGSYTCSCAEGFFGVNCECDIKESTKTFSTATTRRFSSLGSTKGTSTVNLSSMFSTSLPITSHTTRTRTTKAAGGLTSLSFVGTINAEQSQKITEAIQTLVQDNLCKSEQVTVESVDYKRNNGEDSTFSAVISCGGKLVPRDNLKKVIYNLPSDKLNQIFPLPLKTGNQPVSTTPSSADENGWMSKNWGIVVGIGLAIVVCLSAVAVYSLRKRRRHGPELQVPSFMHLKAIEENSSAKEIYLSKSDYIDDTNVRL